jgi:D-serine deaminase-like pyridoxal phosphate-dependent protein
MRKLSPDTPYLVIDTRQLAKNIESMAKKNSRGGINS